MKKLRPTTQYKKDLKRYRNNPQKLADCDGRCANTQRGLS